MTQALLGIDIGTSGCKALLIDGNGGVLASCTETYGLSQPHPGWTEQDPQSWIEGARVAVAGVLARRPDAVIDAVGLSGQMHGATPLDAAHNVLRPAILWNDQRNAAECAEITERAGGVEGLLARTNNRMLLGYTGGKILWMRNHEPDLFAQLRHVVNPKDYLRFVLTGEIATEVSDASGTGFFDVRERCWASGLLDLLEIDPSILPSCHEFAHCQWTGGATWRRALRPAAGHTRGWRWGRQRYPDHRFRRHRAGRVADHNRHGGDRRYGAE